MLPHKPLLVNAKRAYFERVRDITGGA